MSKIVYTGREEFLPKAFSNLKSSNVLLDIGCGIVPHAYVHHNVYIACEPFIDYVNVLNKNIDECNGTVYLDSCMFVLNEDWKSYLDKYEDYAVDTVYLIDVIEHLTKTEGKELLRRTERIAQKQIVIFTPLEYIEQKTLPGEKDAWGMNGVKYQEHKSVWTPDDFEDDGWNFVVCKEYHRTNNIGEVLDKPVGAFWAFKNIKSSTDIKSILEQSEIKSIYQKRLANSLHDKERIFDMLRQKDLMIEELNKSIEKGKIENECINAELNAIKKSRSYRALKKISGMFSQNKMKDLVDKHKITKLLYEVSAEYEKRIVELEAENERLSYLLNDSILFRLERKMKSLCYQLARMIFHKAKDIIICLGLKDYVKRTKFYQIYDKKRGGK